MFLDDIDRRYGCRHRVRVYALGNNYSKLREKQHYSKGRAVGYHVLLSGKSRQTVVLVVRLTRHVVHRHSDAELIIARQEAEHGGVDLVHVEWGAVNSAVVRLHIEREASSASSEVRDR